MRMTPASRQTRAKVLLLWSPTDPIENKPGAVPDGTPHSHVASVTAIESLSLSRIKLQKRSGSTANSGFVGHPCKTFDDPPLE